MTKPLLKCPCCEKMQRKPNYIFCPDCWRAAPPKMRRALLRTCRLWQKGERTAHQVSAGLAELVQETRIVQYGALTGETNTDDVLGAYTE